MEMTAAGGEVSLPNRLLKESICTSSEIDALAPEEEVLFYRLIVNCDDFGRLDARLPILRAKCFPLRIDRVKDKDVERWLHALSKQGLLSIYTVGGEPYLQLTTWEKHQQVRAKRSKYPSPNCADNDLQASDINCNQIISDDIGSESELNPNQTKSVTAKAADQAQEVMDEYNRIFQDFWKQPLALTAGRKKMITARLRRYSFAELVQAMENIRKSNWHCGTDPKNSTFYAKPDFIFRNDDKVDEWLKKGGEARGSPASSQYAEYDRVILS